MAVSIRVRPSMWHELGWSVLTAGATVMLLSLISFDPTVITDYRVWAAAVIAGMIRAMAAAALDWLRRGVMAPADEALADQIAALTPEDREALRLELLRRASEHARREGES
jgi:hypothetical protein